MIDTRQKDLQINELYAEYLALLSNGISEQEAVQNFSYLHPITFSRLKGKIKKGTEMTAPVKRKLA